MKLEGRSSIWMFPIYGMAAFLAPVSRWIHSKNIWLRGFIYTGAIFLTEFAAGSLLKRKDMCPWDYSNSPTNIKGVIRLDYAPYWFGAGLLFEKLLTKPEEE